MQSHPMDARAEHPSGRAERLLARREADVAILGFALLAAKRRRGHSPRRVWAGARGCPHSRRSRDRGFVTSLGSRSRPTMARLSTTGQLPGCGKPRAPARSSGRNGATDGSAGTGGRSAPRCSGPSTRLKAGWKGLGPRRAGRAARLERTARTSFFPILTLAVLGFPNKHPRLPTIGCSARCAPHSRRHRRPVGYGIRARSLRPRRCRREPLARLWKASPSSDGSWNRARTPQ